MDKHFDKERFKETVRDNVRNLFRKTLKEATQQQLFQAVAYAVKDVIIDNWMATQQVMDEEDPKILYYMSMEFLMGRALGNNLINLTAYKEVKEALSEMGFDLNVIEDQEPDAALGNGASAVSPPASLIRSRRSVIRRTAAASVTAMACSVRRSRTATRSRSRMTG